MCTILASHGTEVDPDLTDLCENITAAQNEEIELMQSWLAATIDGGGAAENVACEIGQGSSSGGSNGAPTPPVDMPTPAQTEPLPFDSAPLCAAVWNPEAPPAVADPTILGTVAYLDSVGYFSGVPGSAVLGGTVPWDAYIQIALASKFGALDPNSQTPAQAQCLATFSISLGNTNEFFPVLETDCKGMCT